MKLNPKVTGGLAWAGLIVILAVPSADMLMKPQEQAGLSITSDMDAIRTSSVSSKASEAVKPAADDPVDSYIASGKRLPSYISDAPAAVASKEPVKTPQLLVPTTPARDAAAPTLEVASIEPTGPTVTAPMPYPASMRPKAPAVTALREESPLIVDEDVVARREAAVARVLDDDLGPRTSGGFVTGDQLEEWDSGSLAEYLERRGLLNESEQQASASNYDADGFFLDEGPNSDRRLIRRVRPREFFFF
jgi:hypothetical protein